MQVTNPNYEQILFLEAAGIPSEDGHFALTNPEGVSELECQVRQGNVRLVGSNVVAAECSLGNVDNVMMLHPERFEGCIVYGKNSVLSGAAKLFSTVVGDAFVTQPVTISGGFITQNEHNRLRSPQLKPVLTHTNKSGTLTLNPNIHEIEVAGRSKDVTPAEQALLKRLLESAGTVVSQKELYDYMQAYGSDHTVTVHCGNLRKKLRELGLPDYIETVRCEGYLVRVDD